MGKLNILYLTENLFDYNSSDYQINFIKNLKIFFNLYEYGPGYKFFDKRLNFQDIENNFSVKFDILFLGHSVLSDTNNFHYDSFSNIIKSKKKLPTVMFLNKEYVNLKEKLKFIDENDIKLVFSHHHISKYLNKLFNKKFIFIPFASTFENQKLNFLKKFDLNFIGILKNLNKNYNHENTREIIRNEIFFKLFNINLIKKKDFKNYNILWINHPRNKFESLMLKFTNYKRLDNFNYLNAISQSWLTLNTPSPYNIIGPRYYDALLLGSPIICPNRKFYNHYFDKNDLIQFENLNDFKKKLDYNLKNKEQLKDKSLMLKKKYSSHNYYNRTKDICSHITKI